ENFESYLEDVDFGIRCGLAGKDGVYVPAAVANHRGSATLGRWNKDTTRWIARNKMLLAFKHFAGQPRWQMVAGQLLWGLVAFRHGRGLPWLGGKISGWRARSAGNQQKNPAAEKLTGFLEASEQTIFELQQQTGFDPYWRAYFWLV